MDAETLAESRKPGPFLITRPREEEEEEGFLSEAQPISIRDIRGCSLDHVALLLKTYFDIKFSMLLNSGIYIYIYFDDKGTKILKIAN